MPVTVTIPPEWSVFPLHGFNAETRVCNCGQPTCVNLGKHPKWKFGELVAGEKAPIGEGDGIGLATGERSGVVVIDLDFKPAGAAEGRAGVNGLEALAELWGGQIPDTLTVATPSGGFHLYFRWPGFRIKNSVSTLGPGIDVRGDGGYVVLPPTVHKSGGRYEFLNWGAEVATLPDWLAGRMAAGTPGGAAGVPFPLPLPPSEAIEANQTSEEGWRVIDRATAALRKCPDGRRNAVLFRICAELGDWNHVGEIALEDARHAISAVFVGEGWGDPDKTLDTMERGFLKGRSKERTLVVVGPAHEECNDQAIRALAERDDVYVVGNRLARDTGGGGIAAMEAASLGEILSMAVDWRTRSKEGELRRAHPPDWAIREIFARGWWDGLRVVEGFSEVPVLRRDGTVATGAGYDPATGVVVSEGAGGGLVPMTVDEARAVLDDVFVDFPFELPSHRAALMCAILTPLAMYAFDGPMPLFLFEASTAGSGKTLMATVAALVSTGLVPPVTMYTDDDAEMRKKITSMAQEPSPVALFDNVGKGVKLGGPALCAILSSPDRVWRDRLLGGNVQFKGKLSTVFYATSNQTELAEDMHRRICPIRLEPEVERPEHRTGFAHAGLLSYVKQYRRVLTSAALTLLQGFFAAGRPEAVAEERGAAWGSFDGWAGLVVGCVAWAGYGTPDEAVEALRENGSQDFEEGPEIVGGLSELLVAQGREEDGMTAAEIVEALYPKGVMLGAPGKGGIRLRSFFDGRGIKSASTKDLGSCFRLHKGRVYDGKSIISAKYIRGNRRWGIRRGR